MNVRAVEAEVDVAAARLNAYADWTIPGKVLTIIPTADRSRAMVKVRVGSRCRTRGSCRRWGEGLIPR